MGRHERGQSIADDLALGIPKDPLSSPVPADNPAIDVLTEQRERRQVGEDVEHCLAADTVAASFGAVVDQRDCVADQLVGGDTENGRGRLVRSDDDASFGQFEGRDGLVVDSIAHASRTISRCSPTKHRVNRWRIRGLAGNTGRAYCRRDGRPVAVHGGARNGVDRG